MHRLSRQIRFSVNPFLDDSLEGANSYCSRPAGQGLAIYLEFRVGLVGQIDRNTGFFVNVHEVDNVLRKHAVPEFTDLIRKSYRNARHVDTSDLKQVMIEAVNVMKNSIKNVFISDAGLNLNPNRKIEIDCEDTSMIYFSEKFEFAAMHKLWCSKFSEDENYKTFGKCAHPSGHGHNYVIEVTVKSNQELNYGQIEKTVKKNLIDLLDHRNLNADITYFHDHNPTIENIAVFSWDQLVRKFKNSVLHAVTVWETDKTFCTYHG